MTVSDRHHYAKNLRAGAPQAFKALLAVAASLTTYGAYSIDTHPKASCAESTPQEEAAGTSLGASVQAP
ncbi:hypothetical protein ACGFYV_31300 [Streptomyces sp. NPDC048297]|uniref:hypothetical protein n=1 Tax=Streptomyces sp. NPDC048297 TaxID=3365531 RepID=UPI003711A0F2